MPENIPFFRQYYSPETIANILAGIEVSLANSQLMLGPNTEKLEKRFAERIGVRHAVSLNSCTTALTVCMKHFAIEGGEVLVPSASFITSISSIEFAGGRPVLVEMNPKTLSMDLDDLQKKITPATRGVVWVHLLGFISEEYDQLKEICRQNNLFLLEDAAHALGSALGGRQAGSLADAGCFSFYPTKVLSCGSGGMLTTDNDALAETAKQLRLFGRDPKKGEVTAYGNDWFMDEIRAGILLNHLDDLENILHVRRRQAAYYDKGFAGNRFIAPLPKPADLELNYYQYAVRIPDTVARDRIVRRMQEKHGIATKEIYRPCHLEPVFSHLATTPLPATEDFLAHTICLPLYHLLSQAEQERIITALVAEIDAAITSLPTAS